MQDIERMQFSQTAERTSKKQGSTALQHQLLKTRASESECFVPSQSQIEIASLETLVSQQARRQ